MYQLKSTKTQEMHEANQALKKKNDARVKGFNHIKNDDLIIIWE